MRYVWHSTDTFFHQSGMLDVQGAHPIKTIWLGRMKLSLALSELPAEFEVPTWSTTQRATLKISWESADTFWGRSDMLSVQDYQQKKWEIPNKVFGELCTWECQSLAMFVVFACASNRPATLPIAAGVAIAIKKIQVLRALRRIIGIQEIMNSLFALIWNNLVFLERTFRSLLSVEATMRLKFEAGRLQCIDAVEENCVFADESPMITLWSSTLNQKKGSV